VTRILLPIVVIGAPLVALAAPGQAERALRFALVLAVGGLVVDLLRSVAVHLPPETSRTFDVVRPQRASPPVPAGLVELERDVRLAAMTHLPGRSPRPERVRAVAAGAARRRLARHGLSLDAPHDAEAARAVLGSAVWEFVTRRRATVDVNELLATLEAR
jgi:hypothetical protein